MAAVRYRAIGALMVGVLIAGCGLGPGESTEGEAELVVTRDYGGESLVEASVSDPLESETVLRLLDREAEITTRYGGGFVQSIEGVAGGMEDGRYLDWFFYVDGIESPVGSAERDVEPGDRIWWDYRDWTAAMRVPAVVGSWPEPLLQAGEEDPVPVELRCASIEAACDDAATALGDAGIDYELMNLDDSSSDADAMRVLVGAWGELRSDPAARQLERGPAESGVFARPVRAGPDWGLELLDERGEPVERLGSEAGLVA
ncbi:MAG: DUF4430 domain-containing protein, partial [Solirubrobacterales bacterium]|nr:DUF4430 domain-containing protein [Solirubrobacterales bacterium]